MARTHAAAPVLFRAAVTTTTTREGREPYVSTYYYGPFVNRQQASAALTREKRAAQRNREHAERWGCPVTTSVDGHVECTETIWERVI